MISRRMVLIMLLPIITLLVLTMSVHGQPETDQGQIAFMTWRDMNAEVYVMNADGSNPVNVSNNLGTDAVLNWTADGSQVLVRSASAEDSSIGVIRAANADGSGSTELDFGDNVISVTPSTSGAGTLLVIGGNGLGRSGISLLREGETEPIELTDSEGFDSAPSWSPDGTQIVFLSGRDTSLEIYVMDADGSNVTNLTNSEEQEFSPVWSPDGTQIAFTAVVNGNAEIVVINPDGSNLVNLTNHEADDQSPSWSPDGSQIVFWSTRDEHPEIYVMNADGSNPVNITNNDIDDEFPVWSPPLPSSE